MLGDGGHWLRQNCMIMARASNTPVPFWLSLPLSQLRKWMDDHNFIANQKE